MDKRIGYGLSLREAVEKAMEETKDEEVIQFSFTTREYAQVWAELRDDGWRVYSGLGAE